MAQSASSGDQVAEELHRTRLLESSESAAVAAAVEVKEGTADLKKVVDSVEQIVQSLFDPNDRSWERALQIRLKKHPQTKYSALGTGKTYGDSAYHVTRIEANMRYWLECYRKQEYCRGFLVLELDGATETPYLKRVSFLVLVFALSAILIAAVTPSLLLPSPPRRMSNSRTIRRAREQLAKEAGVSATRNFLIGKLALHKKLDAFARATQCKTSNLDSTSVLSEALARTRQRLEAKSDHYGCQESLQQVRYHWSHEGTRRWQRIALLVFCWSLQRCS